MPETKKPRCLECDLCLPSPDEERFFGPHECRVPLLIEALDGVALSPEETRQIRWLAGHRDTADVFVGLFRKLRQVQAAPKK